MKEEGELPLDELVRKASKAAAFTIDPSVITLNPKSLVDAVSRENQFTPVLENRLKALDDTAKELKLKGGSPELVQSLQKATQDIRNAFVERKTAEAEKYAADAKSAIISAGVGVATLGAGSVLAGTFRVGAGSFALATTAAAEGTTAAATTALTARQLATQGVTRLVVGGTAGAGINGTLAAGGNIARSIDSGQKISLGSAAREGASAAKEGGLLGAGLALLPKPLEQAAGVFFSSRLGASALENAANKKFASAAVDLTGAYAVPAAIKQLEKIGKLGDTAYTKEEIAALKEIVPKLEAQRGKPISPSEYGSILERSRTLKRYGQTEGSLTGDEANARLNEAGLLFSGKNTDPANQMVPKSDPSANPRSLHVVLSDVVNRVGNLEELSRLPYEKLVERVGAAVSENYSPPKNAAAVDAVARAGADYIKSLTPLGESRFRVVQRNSASGPLTLTEANQLLSGKIEGGLKSTTTSANESGGFYPSTPGDSLVIYEIPKGTKGVLVNGEGPVAQAARAEQLTRGNSGFAPNEVAVNIRAGTLRVGEIKTITLADGRVVNQVSLVPVQSNFRAPASIPVIPMKDRPMKSTGSGDLSQ